MTTLGGRPRTGAPFTVLVAVLALAGALAGPGALPAARATEDAAVKAPAVTSPAVTPVAALTHQPAWVAPGDAAVLNFRLLPEVADDLVAEVTVHRAVTSRFAFTRNLRGEALGAVEGKLTTPVSELPVDIDGDRRLVVGIQSQDLPTEPGRQVPGRTGVYPLDIIFRQAGGPVLTRFVSPLVVVAPGLVPLTLAWIWRFDATPVHLPAAPGDPVEKLRPSAVRALAPGGRLARMAAAAAAAPGGDVHLTLAPTPETLEGWTDLVRGGGRREGNAAAVNPGSALGEFRAAAAQPGHQVLAAPYVTPDLPGLLAAGLTGEVDRQFERGAEAMTDALDGSPTPATLLAGKLDSTSLTRLQQYGTERLVVAPDALEPVEQRLTPGRPFLLASNPVTSKNQPYNAAVSDPDLAGLLTSDGSPALQTARFVAGLSLVAFEAPRDQRGVIVVMPPDWSPSSALLSTVMAGLADHPAVLTASLDEYFKTIPPDTVGGRLVVRTLAEARDDEAAGGETEFEPADITATRRQVTALGQVIGSGQPRARAADRALLLGEAEALLADDRPSSKPAATAYQQAARTLVSQVTAKVRGPDGQRVTLTARRGRIPISLLNANPEPLQVRVRLESDQLRFPGGSERLLTLPPQNTTERFAVETRASGAFPLVITVTSPDGALELTTSEVIIRSTVVSGAGATLTAGAGIFLLIWWGNDLRRTRHRRAGRRADRRAARWARLTERAVAREVIREAEREAEREAQGRPAEGDAKTGDR